MIALAILVGSLLVFMIYHHLSERLMNRNTMRSLLFDGIAFGILVWAWLLSGLIYAGVL